MSPLNTAEGLNKGCFCRTLNAERLREQLEIDFSLGGLTQSIAQTRPHLFSSTVVFVSPPMAATMAATVAAIERVIALPQYQAAALARAPAIAQNAFGPAGAFMGYDFHLGPQGPRLIEINTNAGGALLNAALARAQQACCEAMNWAFTPSTALPTKEQTFFDMFAAEWHRQRGDAPIGALVIVDDEPGDQYLAPEFELFRQMFRRHGLVAGIADAKDLEWRDGKLWHHGAAVEMVYNRLTDFYFAEPTHQALRLAYAAGAVVVTPHPRAHALHADKRNLVALSDDTLLAAWGVSERDRGLIEAGVPQTLVVTAQRAADLWTKRRRFFFKPVAGYGAKAAYRGDKLTRRVWGEMAPYSTRWRREPSSRARCGAPQRETDHGGDVCRVLFHSSERCDTMKFSPIALIALLGASVALPVYAQPGPGGGPGPGPGAGVSPGPGKGPAAKRPRFQFNRDNTYGWALMSAEERTAHRSKMLSAKTYDECKAVQDEQHKLMEARAKEKGTTLRGPRQNACDRMKAAGIIK